MSLKSTKFIEVVILDCPSLSHKVNIGHRNRISRYDLKGSLWITPQEKKYHVALSGSVKGMLGPKMTNLLGQYHGTDQDRIYWKIDDQETVKQVINIFSKLE